jgi:hypothetical protein
MTPRIRGIAAVLALVAAAGAGIWWWNSPSRQIQAILDDVATALTRQDDESGLATLSAVAVLEKHLAPDVSIYVDDSIAIEGRDAVITAAARARTRPMAMRVRFFDARVTFTSDQAANVAVTAEVTVRTGSGPEEVVVHQVAAAIQRPHDRWLVSSARIVHAGNTEL